MAPIYTLCAVQPVRSGTGFDLDKIPDASSVRDRELVAINDALDVLMKMDPRKGRLIELRFFGGLSVQEAAEILEVSPQTVMRDWRLARAWLTREVAGLSST